MRTIIAKVGGRGESPFFKGVVTLGAVENTVDKEALDLESEGWYLKLRSTIHQQWDCNRHLHPLSHDFFCKSRIKNTLHIELLRQLNIIVHIKAFHSL